jgi:hypothetical protein
VDREEAEKALAIMRQVVQDTRDDLIERNWGLIWMIHAFTNLAAFLTLGLAIEPRELPIYWYLVPLAIVAGVDLAIVLLLVRRQDGVRSFVEWQLHGIWTTFVVYSALAAVLLYVAPASPRLYCPLLALTSGIGFAMMAVVFYRRFFVFAALFMGVALVAPFLLAVQWVLFGAVWWAALFIPGLSMHRENRRRLHDGSRAELL